MHSKNNDSRLLANPIIKHSFFWLGVFLYFILSVNVANYSGYTQLIESTIIVVIIQMITAYTCIYYLIPVYLNNGKMFLFGLLLTFLLISMFLVYNIYKMYYYDPKYYDLYSEISKAYTEVTLVNRLGYFHVLLGKSIKFLTPTALILMSRFYKDRQKLLAMSEQKKSAELSALKHQLNPHFLFNTLNNLYALSLKKSDQTPAVVEKLSDILDYMLYRCNEQFVSIYKEIELIENYLALEKIRYGNRVVINFDNQIKRNVNIAPLLLLTFIENAFKHGVSEELKEAKIDIHMELIEDHILFNITNTISKSGVNVEDKVHIGLDNVKKQLNLIYVDQFKLTIENHLDIYEVNLKLMAK